MAPLTCPACRSENVAQDFSVKEWVEANREPSSPVHKFVKLFEANDAYGIDFICRCRACGFRFADPYPAEGKLQGFYQEYYANRNYSAKLDKKIRRARRRIEGFLRKGTYKTFLDVGCNVGTAVEAARLCGLAATGIEIDHESVKIAKGLYPQNEFMAVTVEEFAKTGRTFDMIYCTEVLEHIRDIDGFAQSLNRLLAPDGVLFLTTPDGGHWRTPKDVKRWHEMKLPEHISLFSRPALGALAMRHGFAKPHFQFNWKPGIRMTVRKAA